MKKNTHPLKNKTLIVLNNGSSYVKKSTIFKKFLKIDSDFSKNLLWSSSKKIILSKTK
jgi:hypothetical protein